MNGSGTILVTGAARRLGAAVLRDLLRHGVAGDPPADRIVAVDLREPSPEDRVEGVETLSADLRTPEVAAVIARVRPHTVLHLDVLAAPSQAGSRTAMKERNVIGTMQLLAACQKAPSVRRLVVKSSAAVYGCAARDPALFTEDTQPHRPPRSGYGKDVTEVEGYVRGFTRRRPDVAVTVLRFASFLGPNVQTAFVDYLSLPALPTVLGFDPRLQFVHIDDVVRAVRYAAGDTHPGTYNIAGSGVLTLSQIARRLGKPTAPIPAFATSAFGALLKRIGAADFTGDQLNLLTYGRVLDTERMVSRLGLKPHYSTAQAVAAHAETVASRPLIGPDAVAAAERRLTSLLAGRAVRRESRTLRDDEAQRESDAAVDEADWKEDG
ncbi:NAD-dependent epimerase/dehydratase family protein [Actinocrinis puniceicyclus]|uniref:NAD-dependent epimerase/dehydratase family protein n=1 Tax=Actinocrinis puniceicyclus TaxID=977794 RepID=A0A8J7WMF1_9ACTN|nr:NAD-dependent epimerase/dehydratase family protein [Actinocrinis puniceicyclus]MBS2965056.1 NAD-dependent epimerase/dehydratase family protein [Actinocrinis puniceicyclus]